jgi:hypothetical protein
MFAIDKISLGKTVTAACDEANITTAVFNEYIKNDESLNAMYEDAYERGTDSMADALVEIDNHSIYGHTDPKMAKVISDNIKWLLSKRRSKDYGDKIEVSHTITADKAITTALNAGRERAALASRSYYLDHHKPIIEAEVIEEDDEDWEFMN